MIEITVINPTINSLLGAASKELYFTKAAPGTHIRAVGIEWGTASIESRKDETLAASGIMHCAIEAEAKGADAIIINCMDDPGMSAARESVRIPVIGPAETSMHLAAMLCHKFSFITTGSSNIPAVEELIRRYRMSAKVASVRAIDIPVLELESNRKKTLEAFLRIAEVAIRQDGAAGIVPGCTVLAELTPEVSEQLTNLGNPVPVLNPALVALRLAEALVALGLSHSLRTYTRPGEKQVVWPV
jgi:allantoin racemase